MSERIVSPEEARVGVEVPDALRADWPDEATLIENLCHTVATEPDRTRAAVVKALRDMEDGEPCVWYCRLCRRCHANACDRWGGTPEVPCGHATEDVF